MFNICKCIKIIDYFYKIVFCSTENNKQSLLAHYRIIGHGGFSPFIKLHLHSHIE